MRKYITAILIAIFLCIVVNGNAQTDGLGSWSVTNLRYNISKKWLVWSEFQLRSYRFYNHFFYHEMKGGLQYNISKRANVLIGTGQYLTYSTGGSFKSPVTAREYRFWEQFTFTDKVDRLMLEHRYRIEQRWFTTGYRNRFRYRLNLILPINKPSFDPKTFFVTTFNEIFLTNKAPHFERNRFFAGIGYKLSSLFFFQSGYCNQYDYRANGSSVTNHFLQTSLFFNFNTANVKGAPPATPID